MAASSAQQRRQARRDYTAPPTTQLLSLGAGVQSSTLLLLACEGRIPKFDAAIFADTGWEPAEVYRHLDLLQDAASTCGIPIHRVSVGNIRSDALDPRHRFASMPLFTLGPNGERGLARRQCTREYKIRPIKAKVRELLGYPHPSRVPNWVYAQTAIGISVDEFHRAKDSPVGYMRNVFPLLDLGWRRSDCLAYLKTQGWADTPRSACIGCPFHDNAYWRRLRDDSPDEWADAVAFDEAIRHGHPRANAAGRVARGTFYLHRSCVPLAQAPLGDTDEGVDGDPDGCSPWSCRSGHPDGPGARNDGRRS
jgi:3'-phosphoadenosine 5'-phosphosulfate sulfotransferase (PAPS reductase)/FAD synthetase